MICNKNSPDALEKTVSILKSGGVAIVPTDTVYGFSGVVDKKNESSFRTDEKIRKIKGRAETKPLIQLISKPEEINDFSDVKIPDDLLTKWPGALTIIVPVKKDCPYQIQSETVALRCPGDLWLRKVIENCGAPIFSTSVNRSGKPVLDEINPIENEFGGEVEIIINDGDKKGAMPSTIVSLVDSEIKILRQGCVQINNH